MGLEAEVDGQPEAVARITAVARRTACPVFLDLLWPPAPPAAAGLADPGMMCSSAHRVVVFQRVGGELRYYAGGWCPDRGRLRSEQVRVAAEGQELGVVGSVEAALALAQQYVAEERELAAVQVPRRVWSPPDA